MRTRKKWLMVLGAVSALAVGLQLTFWIGKDSISTLNKTRSIIESETAHNENLQQRNDTLKAEVIDLKTGEETMEERARMELGLIKEGETFYRIVEVDDIQNVVQANSGTE